MVWLGKLLKLQHGDILLPLHTVAYCAVPCLVGRWATKRARVQRATPHGRRPGWDLRCVIVKSGDDCRQELLAMQLIQAFSDIFQEAQLPLWLRTYEVGLGRETGLAGWLTPGLGQNVDGLGCGLLGMIFLSLACIWGLGACFSSSGLVV